MTAIYPLGDYDPRVNPAEQKDLRGRATGEFRAPRKGEWYLSGAIPTVYRAPNDLATPFYIMEIVHTRMIVVTRVEEIVT